MATSSLALTHIPKVEALSPLVYRVLGCNPGPFTLQGTNTYLVGNGPKRVLIDTGEKGVSEYVQNLKHALKSPPLNGVEVDTIICTHWHRDHVGGVNDVIRSVIGKNVTAVFKYPRQSATEDAEYAPEGGFLNLKDNQIFKIGGATLRIVFTPGHTDDHVGVWLEEEAALFSGDCVLGEGTTVFEELHSYMASLRKILLLKPQRIYPGHGPVIENGSEKIDEYIQHRDMRESQIFTALQDENRPLSALDIVDIVYPVLPEPVRPAAAANVTHHLDKLVKDGKSKQSTDGMWEIVSPGDDSSKL